MKSPPARRETFTTETETAGPREGPTANSATHSADTTDRRQKQAARPFIPAWLDDAGLSASEMRVFIHLVRSADNKTGVAWPSYRRMIEITGLSNRTIRRAIEALEKPHGLIAKLGKPFAGSCRYRILPMVPPEHQLKRSNSAATDTIDGAPIVPPGQHNECSHGTSIVPPEHQEGNPKKVLQRRKSKDALAEIELPFQSDDFKQAWQDWVQHRKEKKKPITPTSALSQFKAFNEWGEQRSIAAIEHSIRAGWQGIFEPNGKQTTTHQPIDTSTRKRGPEETI